jgi:C-methyltransferase C-terminal domain/Putative zinc binding domain/Methyltransferase domain
MMNSQCQVCKSRDMEKIIDLGMHPPSDAFLIKEQLEGEEKYPLVLLFCKECKLVQLSHAVDPSKLFGSNYVYRTGFSIPLKNHLQQLAEKLEKDFSLDEKDLVIDIGSNDGSLLEGYRQPKILGVEPSPVGNISEGKGIPTLRKFFNEQTALEILAKHGNAKIITATNVFAHVPLESFLKGIKILLSDDGIFCQESHYLLSLMENLEYDSIYLEHLRYYSLESLINLFKMHDMDVFYAEKVSTHGGSIRTFACKKGAYPITSSVKNLLKIEKDANINSMQTFGNFCKHVENHKEELRKIFFDAKAKDKKIVGIGAPAKSTTLLNYCGIGSDIIDYLVEKSDWKIGKFSPGKHIPIVDESLLFREQPACGLLLSWNLKDDIVPKLREKGYKGEIIIPVPKPSIVKS